MVIFKPDLVVKLMPGFTPYYLFRKKKPTLNKKKYATCPAI